MRSRIEQMKLKLKPHGTFWLHCDYRANYKFREMLETIFIGNFLSEIIVQTTYSGRAKTEYINKLHETILVYSKTNDFYFNNNTVSEDMPKSYKHKDEKSWYMSDNMARSGKGDARIFNGKKLDPPKGMHWIWKQERINQAILNEKNNDPDISKDFIIFTKNGYPRVKKYWKGSRQVKLDSLWTDCIKNNWTEDAVDYPTKKPISLLKKIIEIACPPNGVVGDFFSGGGTTLIASALLKRNYIGCDISPVAIKAQFKRFKESEKKFKVDLSLPLVLGMPKSKETYLAMNNKKDKHIFERFLCDLCGWEHLNDVCGQGMGFDASLVKMRTGFQIKNSSTSAGVNDIKALMASIQNSKKFDTGILTAWDLGAKGYVELSKSKKSLEKVGKKIEFVPLSEFLDCFLISEDKEKEIDELLQENVRFTEEIAS
jgi:DNA modification methylase